MKLCIFDMGGVVAYNTAVVPFISKYLGIKETEFIKFAGQENFALLQKGKLSTEDFWKSFSKNYGKEIEEDLWVTFFKPSINPETVAIIHELKQKIRVVLGTNTIDSHYKVHINRGDYSIFQKVYASNIIGYAKPDINFYKYILDSEKVEPSECVFIDDSPKNVEAAISIGINGIVFSDAKSLRRILSEKYKLLNLEHKQYR